MEKQISNNGVALTVKQLLSYQLLINETIRCDVIKDRRCYQLYFFSRPSCFCLIKNIVFMCKHHEDARVNKLFLSFVGGEIIVWWKRLCVGRNEKLWKRQHSTLIPNLKFTNSSSAYTRSLFNFSRLPTKVTFACIYAGISDSLLSRVRFIITQRFSGIVALTVWWVSLIHTNT